MLTHSSRRPPTKVRCKNPSRTYQRRPNTAASRLQDSEECSDGNDDDDDDEDDEDSDASPPILTKAHATLGAKKKVIESGCFGVFFLMLMECRVRCTVDRDVSAV